MLLADEVAHICVRLTAMRAGASVTELHVKPIHTGTVAEEKS
jgi:hypothetical protein